MAGLLGRAMASIKRLRDWMTGAATRIPHRRNDLEDIAAIVSRSVRQNFMDQGRPAPWRPSLRAVQEGGLTMVRTGALFRSLTPGGITREISDTSIALGPDPSLGYGSNLHRGDPWIGPWGVRNVPPRPWFMLQPEDSEAILRIVNASVIRDFDGML